MTDSPQDRPVSEQGPHEIVVVGPDGTPIGSVGPGEKPSQPVTALVQEPAKVMRIGTMVKQLLDEVKAGRSNFHAIEVMACPGGCIGGGGQPLHHGDSSILKARAMAIYEEDRNKPIRVSHENPYILQLYKEYLGEPNSEKAHHLLHTHYFDRKAKIVVKQ